jgi:hypothetical protein
MTLPVAQLYGLFHGTIPTFLMNDGTEIHSDFFVDLAVQELLTASVCVSGYGCGFGFGFVCVRARACVRMRVCMLPWFCEDLNEGIVW